MRLLAKENLSRLIVTLLRARGHDVAWVKVDSPGSLDPKVLDRAQRERRTVARFDKDFSDLAFRQGLHAASGVLFFRSAARTRKPWPSEW